MSYNPNPKLPVPSKYELTKLHHGQKMSGRQMATHYGVSQMQIRRWMKERDITARSRSEAPSGRPSTGKKHWKWMGDKVGYQALHAWVRRYKGTPKQCEHCGTTKKRKYEWANVSGKYSRELSDWVRLCTACHRKFDNNK